jgi:ABC-type transporter Mla subunit MlaD
MSESLAERLKQLAEEKASGNAAEQDAKQFQERVNKFISDNATPEFERLKVLLKEQVDQTNPNLGDLPTFQLFPNAMVQQGNYVGGFNFSKPYFNGPQNQLLVYFGPHPQANYPFGGAPRAQRYEMQAAALDDLSGIVWNGDLGELTSAQLAEFTLEELTKYYLEHKRS